MTPAIVAANLTKVYGEQRAVDELSFEVAWGKVTGFLGPNGAGKTTTLRMVLGLARPSTGHSKIMGAAYAELDRPTDRVGALLETQQFHPLRSARNHLRVYAAAGDVPDDRVDEVLDLVELSAAATKKVGQFSLGMKQRLGLATALLGDPRILVLDEPANGLDPSGIRWLRSFLRGFAAGDRAAFVSSHLLAEVTQMADEAIVIDHGRLVAHAGIPELLTHAGRRVRARTDEPERLRDLMITAGKPAELTAHDVVVVKGVAPETVGRAASAAGITLLGLDSDEETLEDVFFELTGSEER
jgi:ABC-2 type transport system ATP-binding protein